MARGGIPADPVMQARSWRGVPPATPLNPKIVSQTRNRLGSSRSELLTAVFGYWPSFHDAEVTRITLETADSHGPDLAAVVHAFEITDQVGADGCYVLRHHVLVTLRFRGVDQLKLEDFNNQNALWGLELRDIRDRQLELLRYAVAFQSSFGVSAEFLCAEALVESVEPWQTTQKPAAGGAG